MGGAEEKSDTYFLMCERNWIYNILITVAGFYGAFTYMLRGTVFCKLMLGRAIWLTLLPLGVVFAALLHADLTTERDMVERKPAGH